MSLLLQPACCRGRTQDLEAQLRGSLVRTGSGVCIVAEEAPAQPRSVPAHLAQFGEAQRIIVLDAVRADLGGGPRVGACEAAGALNGAINGDVFGALCPCPACNRAGAPSRWCPCARIARHGSECEEHCKLWQAGRADITWCAIV